jgi:cytochrome P450
MADFSQASWVDASVRAAPHAFLAHLREEEPVYRDPAGAFIVTRFESQREILRDSAHFSSQAGVLFTRYQRSSKQAEIEALYAAEGCFPLDVLITIDPPDHTRYRRPVQEAFLPKKLQTMPTLINDFANSLIDKIIDNGQCDYASDIAIPLPIAVIARELAVPPKDYGIFKQWSDDIVEHVHPYLTPEREVELVGNFISMQRYFKARIEELRAEPSPCLLSSLIQASGGPDGLTTQELISIVMVLILAGNETTGNALGWAALHLAKEPALADRLRNPANSNEIEVFVEEVLRLNPTAMPFRISKRDTEVDGTAIPAGSVIWLPLMSGNYDRAAFSSPESIALDRPNVRQHLTFGQGIHICLGMHLARMEMTIGIRETLRRMTNLRLDPHRDPVLNPGFGVWGLSSLPILFDKLA